MSFYLTWLWSDFQNMLDISFFLTVRGPLYRKHKNSYSRLLRPSWVIALCFFVISFVLYKAYLYVSFRICYLNGNEKAW